MNFTVNDTSHKNRQVETTEWEDILVEKGIISEREEVRAQREAFEEARGRTERDEEAEAEKELSRKTLEQLKLVEDDFDEDVLEKLREARLKELKAKAKTERFGEVYPLAKADFVRDVTEASKSHWVVVEMFKDGIRESTKASELLREVARRHPEVKFVRIRSTDCVENWPDHSVPCLFLYSAGKMQQQLIGLNYCGGADVANADTMELALAVCGVLEVDDQEDTEYDAIERENRENAERGTTTVGSSVKSKVSDLPNTRKTTSGAVLASLNDDDDDDDW